MLAAVYTPAEVAAGTYPFVTEPVTVVAVKAVLVTFDFQPERNAYQAASCGLVADMSHLVADAASTAAGRGSSEVEGGGREGHPAGLGGVGLRAGGAGAGLRVQLPQAGRDGGARRGWQRAVESEPNRLFLQRVCARMGC